MKKVIPFLFVCILLFNGCELINPAEDTPAFLKIDSFTFTTIAEQGTDSNKITDVWVSVNGELLGTYEIPARIPILELGAQEVKIFAGIKANGDRATSDLYPFYESYDSTIEFVSGEDVELAPTFAYTDETDFRIVESFEGLNHLFSNDMDGDSETAFRITANGFEDEGGFSVLTGANRLVRSGSDLIMEFPLVENGYISYVELNCKTDVRLDMGLIGYDAGGNEVFTDFDPAPGKATFKGVNPTDEWKKVYFDFSSSFQACAAACVAAGPGSGYRMILRAEGDGVNQAEIFLDNFKFIHF